MKGKKLRQARIRELLQDTDLETHEMLAAALRRRGIEVSQSTLSKDLRELGVVRMPRPEGLAACPPRKRSRGELTTQPPSTAWAGARSWARWAGKTLSSSSPRLTRTLRRCSSASDRPW